MQPMIRKAMQDSDNLVVEFNYCDSKGQVTRRVVSPIRMINNERFLALCLGRAEPRQFYLNRCSEMKLQAANDYLMPIAM